MLWLGTEVCVCLSVLWITQLLQCRRPVGMVASSFASNRKSSAMARKSKTRCSPGKLHPSVPTCLTAATALPLTLSFTSLLGWHTETSRLLAVVANCVCLCSSDCESREVLTLLCQGKMFTEIYYHRPPHCGHSLTLFHMLSSSFSCDLCGFFFVLLWHLYILSGVSPSLR